MGLRWKNQEVQLDSLAKSDEGVKTEKIVNSLGDVGDALSRSASASCIWTNRADVVGY